MSTLSDLLVFIFFENGVIDHDRLHELVSECQAREPWLSIVLTALPLQSGQKEPLPDFRLLEKIVTNSHNTSRQRVMRILIGSALWKNLAEWQARVDPRRQSTRVIVVAERQDVDIFRYPYLGPVEPREINAQTNAVWQYCRDYIGEVGKRTFTDSPPAPPAVTPRPIAPIINLPAPTLTGGAAESEASAGEPPAPPATDRLPSPTPAEKPAPPPAPQAQTPQELPPPPQWKARPPRVGDVDARLITHQQTAGDYWSLVGASRVGKQHLHYDGIREDAFRIEKVGGWCLAAVADGGGSYKHAGEGARVAVERAIAHMATICARQAGLAESSKAVRTMLMKAVWEALTGLEDAALDKLEQNPSPTSRDFSTTLLLVAYHSASGILAYTQIGDGLIAAQVRDGSFQALGVADTGDYAAETAFLSRSNLDDLKTRTQLLKSKEPLRAIVLLTDGVAEDFYPVAERLSVFMDAVFLKLHELRPAEQLLELLSYEMRGSFDDRTAVIIYDAQALASAAELRTRVLARRPPTPPPGNAPPHAPENPADSPMDDDQPAPPAPSRERAQEEP